VKLRIYLDTLYPETVSAILEESDFRFGSDQDASDRSCFLYSDTDEQYREWTLWIAAALACGLLYGGRIERE